jgi:hypothetical protein
VDARRIRQGAAQPLAPLIQTSTLTYPSSIDAAIPNLHAELCWDARKSGWPLLVLMHGYGEDCAAITPALRTRMASYGFFAVVVGMRGRNGAAGARDASGREIGDILDAVVRVRELYPVSPPFNRVAIIGYSGGAGNALGCLAKAPDFFSFVVSNFGPSDYGSNFPNAWYYTNPGFAPSLDVDVGATPAAEPGWWKSRAHVEALDSLALAPPGVQRLALYHDSADVAVSVVQSDRVRDTLNAAGLADRFYYRRSEPGQAVRYLHGYPDTSPGLLVAEGEWVPRALATDGWTVPSSGSAKVRGFLVTKRFSCWLGLTSGGADPRVDPMGGKVHAATLSWTPGYFVLTPETGPLRYRLERIGGGVVIGDTAGPVTIPLGAP